MTPQPTCFECNTDFSYDEVREVVVICDDPDVPDCSGLACESCAEQFVDIEEYRARKR